MKAKNKIMKKIISVFAAVLVLTSCALSALASTFKVVKGGALNLRETPSLSANVLSQYNTGTWVEVLSEENEWSKVKVQDKNGYMMSKYLGDGSNTQTRYVRTNTGIGLNLRKGPGTGYDIITSFKVNTKVNVIVQGKEWSKVSVNGTEGYMASRFLSPSQAPSYTKPVNPFKATLKNINGGSVVNFRKAPGMNTAIIKSLPVGTEVTVYEMGENWSLVEYDNTRGYVSTYFLKY